MTKIIPTLSPEFAKRRAYRNSSPFQEIWNILDNVFDPELPGLTIWDLGILQDVKLVDGAYTIVVTPTYSGCPAVETINSDIKMELAKAGYDNVILKVILAPAWTTEMMSPAGKAHLKSINIAPPDEKGKVVCPNCNSENIKLISQFGSTACKSLHQCADCSEVFDYFKHF
jgi:ring-1,2-phenylacetyl-CoA epoxidase subunit PaaD